MRTRNDMLSLVQVLYCFLLNRVVNLGQIILPTCVLAMKVLCNSKVTKEQSDNWPKVSPLS